MVMPYSNGTDLFNNPAQAERELVAGMKQSFGELSKEIVSSKIDQQSIINQSIREGGPSSPQEAILNLMDYCNVGIRELSRRTNVRRKVLLAMVHGRIPMPPETLGKLHDIFKERNPKLFETSTQ